MRHPTHLIVTLLLVVCVGSAARAQTSPAALLSADLTWSVASLDRWLADPGEYIAGAKMPIRILDASTRRDIIAYLQMESRKSSGQSERRSVAQSQSDPQQKE